MTPRLCKCGCGEPVVRPTAEWLRGHHNKPAGPDYIVNDNGCWIWQRSIGNNGYGRLKDGHKWILAHRVYFQKAFGYLPELPLQLDHFCRDRRCVNPEHLQVVDYAGNARNKGPVRRLSGDSPRRLARRNGDAVGISKAEGA